MKAANARKRRAQRGRPRADGVLREANGRACRADEPVMAVVINARIRHGVSPEEAPRQEGGTALGRLWGQKLITTTHKDAGEAFAQLSALADRYVCGRPHGFERHDGAGGLDWDSADFDREAYAERAIGTLAKREGLRAALVAAMVEKTVTDVCILDELPTAYGLPTLRAGLDILARNFKVGA